MQPKSTLSSHHVLEASNPCMRRSEEGTSVLLLGKGKFTIARVKKFGENYTYESYSYHSRVTELIKNKYVSTQSAPAPRPLALLFARRCRRTTIPRERRWRGCAGQSEDVAFSLSIFIIFQFLIISDYRLHAPGRATTSCKIRKTRWMRL